MKIEEASVAGRKQIHPIALFSPPSLAVIQNLDLKSKLEQLLRGSISESELTEFVHLCRTLIQAHITAMRSSLHYLCQLQGLTITDLSYDCLGEVFARNESYQFPQIQSFVASLRESLTQIPDRDLFLAFKSFLIRVADAQLARLYALTDPPGAKIHRNVRDCLKRTSFFTIERDYQGLRLNPTGCEENNHLAAYPIEELERQFLSRTDWSSNTSDHLQSLHEILMEAVPYRKSILLLDFVQILKKVYLSGFLNDGGSLSVDGLTPFELERIRAQVELGLKEKIYITYLAHGKIGRKEAEAMFLAFRDILSDWCSGEESRTSLFYYLEDHLTIDASAYETTYRAKMEYLVKIARDEFASRLMKEL